MSALYAVEVDNLSDDQADLRVFIIHPDVSRIHATPNFVLRALLSPDIEPRDHVAPLFEAISTQQILDEDWVDQQATHFVSAVTWLTLPNLNNTPDWAAMNGGAYPANKQQLTQAVMRITVTDPQWLSHIHPNLAWSTTAYDY